MPKVLKQIMVFSSILVILGINLKAWSQADCPPVGNCDTNFIAERVGIVDFYRDSSSTCSLVVRGNLPLIVQKDANNNCINPRFAYDELNNAIRNLATKNTFCPDYLKDKSADLKSVLNDFDLSAYELIDISLLNNTGEAAPLIRELNAFGLQRTEVYDPCACWPPINVYPSETSPCSVNNSHQVLGQHLTMPDQTTRNGKFVWWPFDMWGGCGTFLRADQFCCDTGCNHCQDQYYSRQVPCADCMPNYSGAWANIPCKDPRQLYTQKEQNGPGKPSFDFPGLVDFISQKLKEPGKKRVIYFHCVQGTDRTGAVHVGYLLKNYNLAANPVTLREAKDYALNPQTKTPPNDLALRVAAGYCQWLASSGSGLPYDCGILPIIHHLHLLLGHEARPAPQGAFSLLSAAAAGCLEAAQGPPGPRRRNKCQGC
jgi:hypothetical protein